MSDATPNLALPLIAAAQAQKHVTHNEALAELDALVQLACLDKDRASPPPAPAEGDRYLVASANPTGAWAGLSGQIARFQDGYWLGTRPKPGWLAWIVDEGDLYAYSGTAWVSFRATLTALQGLTRLGIGTTADADNPFAAKLNKALWTALTTGEGGSGDLRYTLNKQAAGNVLSFLFQTGFSARAELGLNGDDDLSLKVSGDGAAFREALRVNRNTGALALVAGSAGAPALASAGDTDTGTFSPGANLWAVATAGAERLRLDGNGNLGLGTATPTERLHVGGNAKVDGNMSATGKGSMAGGLDATPIGATTRSTGAFTTLSTTGSANFGGAATAPLLGVDATAYYTLSAGNPVFAFDANDYFGYNRTTNTLGMVINTVTVLQLQQSSISTPGTFTAGGAIISQGPTNYGGFFNRCSGVTSVWGHDSTTNRTTLQTWAGGTSTTTGTTPYDFCLQPSGGNVGIGNGAPGERLHITGNTRVDGSVIVRAGAQYSGVQVSNGSGVLVATIQGNSATNTGGTMALADTAGAFKTILRGDGADSFVSGTFRPAAYTVATLPTAGTAGRMAWTSNGRAYNGAGTLEGAGSGTGCLVTDTGTAWKIAGTNQTVQA